MTFAVDFDGTLSLGGDWPKPGTPNDRLIKYLNDRKQMGDKIILWTCRTENDLKIAVDWCTNQGLEFDAVNDNLPEVVEYWGVNSRKVESDVYIDDKSVWDDLYVKYPINEEGQ